MNEELKAKWEEFREYELSAIKRGLKSFLESYEGICGYLKAMCDVGAITREESMVIAEDFCRAMVA